MELRAAGVAFGALIDFGLAKNKVAKDHFLVEHMPDFLVPVSLVPSLCNHNIFGNHLDSYPRTRLTDTAVFPG
jgi:hypothetical protein